MTRDEFLKTCEEQYQLCLAEMKAKGGDYAEETDVFANFYDDAKALDISVYQAIGIHLNKQFRAIRKWLSGTELKSEGIDSRITDMISYLMLLKGIVVQSGIK